MKIKMPVLTWIFVLVIIAALVIGTIQMISNTDHNEHENMPSPAQQMEKAQGRGQ